MRAHGPRVVVVLEGDQTHVRASDDALGDLRKIRLQPGDEGGRVGIDASQALTMLAVPFVVDAVTVSVSFEA